MRYFCANTSPLKHSTPIATLTITQQKKHKLQKYRQSLSINKSLYPENHLWICQYYCLVIKDSVMQNISKISAKRCVAFFTYSYLLLLVCLLFLKCTYLYLLLLVPTLTDVRTFSKLYLFVPTFVCTYFY